jgi:tetratricopeptide (TPR) repeat protein
MKFDNIITGLFLSVLLLSPGTAIAQRYYSGTSMEIVTTSNTHARDCYRAATIAARIHYTSRKEIENCTFALDYTSMSLRDRAATLANRGIIYMALEEYQSAIRDYSASLRLQPDFGEIYVNIGNVYYMGQVYDKAVLEYTTAIEKNTSLSHVAYLNRGMAYESLGDFVNAENDYKTAAEILPEWIVPQNKLKELQIKKEKS